MNKKLEQLLKEKAELLSKFDNFDSKRLNEYYNNRFVGYMRNGTYPESVELALRDLKDYIKENYGGK